MGVDGRFDAAPGGYVPPSLVLAERLYALGAHDPRWTNVPFHAAWRAQALLLRHLSYGQRLELAEHHYFTVRGSEGDTYRIYWPEGRRSIYNVRAQLDWPGRKVWLGFYPMYRSYSARDDQYNMYAAGDRMLAQKILLETDELCVLGKACAVTLIERDQVTIAPLMVIL